MTTYQIVENKKKNKSRTIEERRSLDNKAIIMIVKTTKTKGIISRTTIWARGKFALTRTKTSTKQKILRDRELRVPTSHLHQPKSSNQLLERNHTLQTLFEATIRARMTVSTIQIHG